jgi:glycosyltransferase involved in cell wall biosynthesis
MSAFSFVDEVWVATEFGRRALAACAPVPVVRMPLPLVPGHPAALDRSHFRLRQDAFVFLFTFDVSSQLERKNPDGVVSAFRRAFGTSRDVVLLLKLTNPEYDPGGLRKLYSAVNGSNIVLWEGYMTRAELTALVTCSDCYVSLHRSEGFGLGIAEAMALGKPVIATHYSGPADFMNIENSYPVNYTVVPIPRDYGPYLEGFAWADPDLEQASALMREVVEDRADAQRRGRRAAADMAEHYAPERAGARIRRRLENIRSGHARITTQD